MSATNQTSVSGVTAKITPPPPRSFAQIAAQKAEKHRLQEERGQQIAELESQKQELHEMALNAPLIGQGLQIQSQSDAECVLGTSSIVGVTIVMLAVFLVAMFRMRNRTNTRTE